MFPSLADWMPRTARVRAWLVVAVLFHLSLLVSWRVGFYNRLAFDSVTTHGWRGWDFYALYQAGHNVLTGISAYESDNDKIEVVVPRYTPYRYLPLPAYTLGVFLNLFSPLWAFHLWVGLTESVLLACAWLSWRMAHDREQGAILAAMWLLFTPYYLELYLGQFSLAQGALVFLMMLLAARPTPDRRFDLTWIASLLWKQNTGLFIPILLRLRRWRALAWAALAVLVTSAPYFLLYPAALPAFLGNLASGPPASRLGNLGMRQFLYSLTSALWPALQPDAHALVQAVWVLAVVAAGLWLTWRDRSPHIPLHLCLWMTTYFLVYHDVWEHHYVLLLPVFVTLYRRKASRFVLLLYGLIAMWTPYILIDPQGIAAFHMPMHWTPLEPRALDVAYHAVKAVPALLLWGYSAVSIRRRATQGEAA